MKMGADVEQKIAQLQLLEQNMQNFLAQKQNFQAHELEINNAIDELGKSKGNAYKIVGSIMILQEDAMLRMGVGLRVIHTVLGAAILWTSAGII